MHCRENPLDGYRHQTEAEQGGTVVRDTRYNGNQEGRIARFGESSQPVGWILYYVVVPYTWNILFQFGTQRAPVSPPWSHLPNVALSCPSNNILSFYDFNHSTMKPDRKTSIQLYLRKLNDRNRHLGSTILKAQSEIIIIIVIIIMIVIIYTLIN